MQRNAVLVVLLMGSLVVSSNTRSGNNQEQEGGAGRHSRKPWPGPKSLLNKVLMPSRERGSPSRRGLRSRMACCSSLSIG